MPRRAASASGLGTRRDQVVASRLDLDLVLRATDDHRLPEHVLSHHDPAALDRLDCRPDRRERASELDVRLVLVPETALEPPAHARELRGVEREALLLRHLDRDGLELLQPGGAAELASARS